MKKVYGLWLLAFSLKLFGAAWDTSWHFKYFFDTFSPPHNINTVGFLLAWALVIYHWGSTDYARRWAARLRPGLQSFTRQWIMVERLGNDRHMDMGSLWITTTGLIVFLIAAPIDQLWHRIFGLDLTTWSPTHLGLFAGTELAILGVLMGVYRHGRTDKRGSFDSITLILLSGFLLEAFLFACGQQEYGYIALYAINHPDYVNVLHHTTFPIPALIAQSYTQGGPQALATGNVPTWLYPLYQLLIVTLILQFARLLHRRAWTATAVAALYLAYRLLARFLLHTFDFPVSFVPYYLIGIALSLDLFGTLSQLSAKTTTRAAANSGMNLTLFGRKLTIHWAAIIWGALAAAGATAAVYAGGALIQRFEVTPPIPPGSPQFGFLDGGFPLGFLLSCLGLWLAYQVVALLDMQARLQEARSAAKADDSVQARVTATGQV
jgi:hypothetical protein